MDVRLHTIGMVVADMRKSVEFYRLLGLTVLEGEANAAHTEMRSSTGVVLGLDAEDTVRRIDPQWRTPAGGERLSLQFEVEGADAVDAVFARLIDAGAESYKEPWDAFWGQRFAQVRDPDGNVVGIFAATTGGA